MILSLRLLVPILFLLLALAQSVIVVYFAEKAFRDELLESAETTLRSQMTQYQDTLVYLLRKQDLDQAQREISALGSDVALTLAALFDDEHRAIMATSLADRGASLKSILARLPGADPLAVKREFDAAGSRMRGSVWYGENIDTLYGAYPVVFDTTGSSLRPNRTGVLFIVKDLSSVRQQARAELRAQMTYVIGLIIATAVLIAVAIHLLVSRRIRTLAMATTLLAKGDHDSRAPVTGGDELSELGRAFNQMAEDVSAKRLLLETEREQRQLLLDSAAEAIYGIDAQGCCTFVNPACLRILGYDHPQQLLGRNMHSLIHARHSDGSPYHERECNIFKAVFAGKPAHFDDEVFVRRDGSTVAVEYWAHPVLKDGQLLGAVITFFDVTEQKRLATELAAYRENLEVVVAKRTAELNATNKELESYSYSIAHDLRAPLRSITSFGQILLEDAAVKLSPEEKDCLDRIIRAGQQMDHLIRDILNLSRITRAELRKKRVDISQLAHELVEQLCPQFRVADSRVQIEKGLQGHADPDLLRLALQNLIGNALKFSAHNPQPALEIGQLKDQATPVFFVRDNGVGFDMRFAEKLFRPFERLHSVNQFEGTGVGLASAQRAIQRHGGKVWAEAQPGVGATFYFTLEHGEEITGGLKTDTAPPKRGGCVDNG